MEQQISTQFELLEKYIDEYTDYYLKDEGEGGYVDSIGEKYLLPNESLVQVIESLNDILERNEDEKVDIANALDVIPPLFSSVISNMFSMGRALGQTQTEIVKLKTEIRDLNQTVQRLTPIEPGDLPSGGRRKSRRLRKRFRRTRK
jgi:hypothetical protein